MARPVPARLSAAAGRRFAFTVGAAMLVLGGIAAWRGRHPAAAWILGAAGTLLIVAGLVAPTRLGPVERAWYALAAGISKITTPIIMGALYFLILTPAGVIARVFGHNPLRRSRAGSSAWVRRPEGARRGDLERQF